MLTEKKKNAAVALWLELWPREWEVVVRSPVLKDTVFKNW